MASSISRAFRSFSSSIALFRASKAASSSFSLLAMATPPPARYLARIFSWNATSSASRLAALASACAS